MRGTHAASGAALSGLAHLRQSIRDILTTPIGSRVFLRDYGSDLPALIDHPVNAAFLADLYAATAQALDRWEPRFRVRQVTVTSVTAGTITLTVSGTYVADGREITLEGMVIA